MQSHWKSGLETGLAELDDDHKQLLEKAGALIRAATQKPLGEMSTALHSFHAAAQAHFAREEGIMAQFKYDGADKHWQEHQQMLTDIRAKIAALDEFTRGLPAYGEHIHAWLNQHIMGQDILFGRAVHAQIGTTDRRRTESSELDAAQERRLDNLEAMLLPDNAVTGITTIDEDYPALIGLLNEIVEVDQATDRHHLGTLLERLGDSIASHFTKEEALMNGAANEPNEAHREEHVKLLDEFAQLVDDWESDRISAELLCRFMHRWLLRHIATADMPLGKALARRTS